VVVLFGEDYENREALLEDFRNQIEENVKNESIIIVATGMAVYDPEKDDSVTSVFERADDLMYENKRNLKKKKIK
jgi:GGDEF domain-containing protein